MKIAYYFPSLPERPVYEGTTRGVVYTVRIGRQRTREEGRTEVDSDGSEPDHEGTEEDALRGVHQQRCHQLLVFLLVLGEDRGVVEDRGEHVDRRHRHQEEEGRLDQRALPHWLAAEDAEAEGDEDGCPSAVHHGLVEEESLRPPVDQQPLSHANDLKLQPFIFNCAI